MTPAERETIIAEWRRLAFGDAEKDQIVRAGFRLQSVEWVRGEPRVDQQFREVARSPDTCLATGAYRLAGAHAAVVTMRLTPDEIEVMNWLNERITSRLYRAAHEASVVSEQVNEASSRDAPELVGAVDAEREARKTDQLYRGEMRRQP